MNSTSIRLRPLGVAVTLAVSLWVGTAPTHARQAPAMDYSQLVEQHGAAVVHVRVRGKPGPATQTANATPPSEGPPSRSFGSGFVVSPDGYILTNAHVVANAIDVYVQLTDKRELRAKVVGTDAYTDVAVLKIDATGLPTVRIGSADKVRVGEPVAAIGSPFGFEHTITSGIVSAKSRNVDDQFVPFIQTDAAINPGNSGGPLFNAAGEVIGINSRIWSRSGGFMGLSFAIPIDIAMQVAEDLKAGRKVVRGAIGVTIQPVSPELARAFGLDRARGALVLDVESGGPAQRAGIRTGDVILAADGREIDTSLDLPRVIGGLRPGSVTRLQVLRDGATLPVQVDIVELRQDEKRVATVEPQSAPESTLGLVVRPLNPEEQKRIGWPEALMVESVAAASPALRAEVKAGDVILGLRGQPFRSLEHFREQLKHASEGPLALLLLRGNQRKFVAVEAY